MVLIEAISVVLRRRDVDALYRGGWQAFERDVLNPTLCTDGELVRVGFMSPADVEDYVRLLRERGLQLQADGRTRHIAVVDQMRGATAPCDWLDLRKVNVGEGTVLAGAQRPSQVTDLAVPRGWKFETSLSRSSGYVPPEHVDKTLVFLRHEDGVDVYRSELTGKEVFVGRSAAAATARAANSSSERDEIEGLARRALDLEIEAERCRAAGDRDGAARVYGELMKKLLPRAEQLANETARYGSFANFAAGLVLRVLHLYEQALVRFERAHALQPDVPNTLLELTGCLGQLGRPKDAEKYARRAVALEPQSPEAWGNLAMCLIQLRQKSEARAAIDRAVALNPEDPKNKYIAENFERLSQ